MVQTISWTWTRSRIPFKIHGYAKNVFAHVSSYITQPTKLYSVMKSLVVIPLTMLVFLFINNGISMDTQSKCMGTK
jgi:hypothetical protein